MKKIKYILFTFLACFLLVRYGGKFEFNPYTVENRKRTVVDIRFVGLELYSRTEHVGPSWLQVEIKDLGYNDFQNKDYWISTGAWSYGFAASFWNPIDRKGRTNTKFRHLVKSGRKAEALEVWADRLKELRK